MFTQALHLPSIRTLALAVALAASSPVFAGNGYYLVTTYPNEGQKSVDFKYWASTLDGVPLLAAPELGLAYNVNRAGTPN